jgi:hypothetical protein
VISSHWVLRREFEMVQKSLDSFVTFTAPAVNKRWSKRSKPAVGQIPPKQIEIHETYPFIDCALPVDGVLLGHAVVPQPGSRRRKMVGPR